MADKTRGRTERNHAKYVFQAAPYFTPVTCYNSFKHWYAYRDSLNIHRTSNKGTKCQDIVLKCQAWERKKGKTSLWPLRREESRAQNRSQPVSHLLLSGLSRGSVHLQLYPLSLPDWCLWILGQYPPCDCVSGDHVTTSLPDNKLPCPWLRPSGEPSGNVEHE